jgi:hydrogenase nickel incorporation protein HypA/HybF
MHEGSIAAALVQSVLEVQEKERLGSVKAVTVCIGRLHHVVPELLQSAYRILKKEHPALVRSRLVIEVFPVRITCRACGRETEIEKPEFACSACGSTAIEVSGGREMHLKEITGTEAKVKSKNKTRK